MASDKDYVVAIELSSSRISGIAGKKKDGTMQVLAYAEENTTACVKRGVVWNIEKTYQSINSIINKLETSIKAKITRVYVGVAGQSLRSYKCVIKRNMVTHSYITQEAVASLRDESYEIPFADCQVLDNVPQEYVVDSNVVADPVGVMGTNIEGEFLDVIANQKILQNIKTVFGNTNVQIADIAIAPCELANQVLTDVEKRSGCALVDLGADTTTVVVCKNNIIRFVVTIPLGMNNVNKDFASINIFDAEAEEVKLKFADACPNRSKENATEMPAYITSDGHQVDAATIQSIIEARVNEIIANVTNQLDRSNYSDKLLAGIVITGGGSNIAHIDQAFLESTKVEKIRIATSVNAPIIKGSGMGNPTFETAQGLTILSLLLYGKDSCCAEPKPQETAPAAGQVPDLIEQMQAEDERMKRQKEAEAQALADAQMAIAFDGIKNKIRNQVNTVLQAIEEVKKYGNDKKVREQAAALNETALNVITEEFQKHVDILSSKEKYKQSASEGVKLADKLREVNSELRELVMKAKNDNKLFNRIGKFFNDIVNEN